MNDPRATKFSRGGRFAARNSAELCFESRHVSLATSDNIAFPDERYVCFELQAASDGELDQVRTGLELLSGKTLAPIVMAESVTASLAAGIIVAVLAVMAIARAVKRRTRARDSESQPIAKHAEREERRARRAS